MVFKMLFAGTTPSTVRAGETLNGSLQICATQETPAQRLVVELVGEERASVAVREGKRRRRANREAAQAIYRKEIDTTRMNHMIARRGGAFPEGSCEVEFSIALPASLPGSTRIAHGNGGAKIEYSLRAVLKGSGTCISHKAEKAVRVRALPPEEAANVLPRLVKPRCQTVRGTFRHHGQVFCGAQAKHSLLQPGQEADIDLAVLNQSKTPIRTVQIVLRERVRWSAQRASKTVMTNLVTHSVDVQQHSAPRRSSLLGNSSNSTTSSSRRRGSFSLLHQLLPQEKKRSDREQASLRRVVEQLQLGNTTNDDDLLSFRLPPVPTHARNTHVGTRLCVTHEVILTLLPEEGCWKRNPEVRIPVRIFNDDNLMMDDHNSLEPGKELEEESLTTEDLTTSYNSSLELEASNNSRHHVETKWLAGGACPAPAAPAPALDAKDDAGRRGPNITISASA